jgi:sialate O-acetylesterase
VPKAEIGKAAYLYLGTAIDEDFIYINGNQIGHTGYRYPPRNYKIDKLPSGKCTIAIRLLNHYGDAHFTEGKPHFLVTDSAALSLENGWKVKRGCYFRKMPEATFFAYKPTGLFNAMFAPLEHFNLKGILWYQGESDCADAENYSEKFCNLINAWRKKLGKNASELPFLFAQLPYQFYNENEDWDALRAEQFKALKIENTGMIFTQDIGEYNDLHPQNKYLIAYRFSRLARKLAYGEKIIQTPFELTGYIDS